MYLTNSLVPADFARLGTRKEGKEEDREEKEQEAEEGGGREQGRKRREI